MSSASEAGRPEQPPRVRELCDVRASAGGLPGTDGVLWKLAEPGRQLDANLIRLPAGERIGTHAEPDLDVLVLVVSGDGVMNTPDGAVRLAEGALLWLPHGSTRGITAGSEGLAYVTVHRRRPGMRIGRPGTVSTEPGPVSSEPGPVSTNNDR